MDQTTHHDDSPSRPATTFLQPTAILENSTQSHHNLLSTFYKILIFFALVAGNIGLILLGNFGMMLAFLADIVVLLTYILNYPVETNTW